MKILIQALIIFILSVAANCSGTYSPSIKKIQQNKMDFPDPEKRMHSGFSFELSKLFTDSYTSNFVLQKQATTKSISDINIFFSVETFDKSAIDRVRFAKETNDSDLELIHNYYLGIRMNSLYEKSLSTRKNLPKKVGFKGYTQQVIGRTQYDEKKTTYLTASVQIDQQIHVFQLIGPSENMGYFYDDFIRILESIEK